MNYYYDTYSQSLAKEIPNSKNSLLKTMISLEKFEKDKVTLLVK